MPILHPDQDPCRGPADAAATLAVAPVSVDTGIPKPPLIILILLAAMGAFALNVFMPSMPGLQAVFGVDYGVIQLTLTAYLAAMAISQLVFGPLSDRFGRKPILFAGFALFVTGSAMAASAPAVEWLIAARALQGAGGAVGIAIGRAIIRDVYGRSQAASMIGYTTMAMVLAPMFAPMLGGFLDERFGWRIAFVLLVAVGLMMALLVAFGLKETNPPKARNPDRPSALGAMFAGGRVLLTSQAFVGYVMALAFGSAGFFTFIGAAPYIIVELMQLSPTVYGTYFALGAFGYMMGNFLSGRFSQRLGPDRMIAIGVLIGLSAALALLIFAYAGIFTPFAIFGPMAVFALSNGLVLPNATAGAVSVRPDHAGAAAGIAGASQLGIGALCTVLVSVLENGTQFPMIYVMTATAIISATGMAIARDAAAKSAAG